MPSASPSGLKVAIVAEHASACFGGEAVLPLHYFRILRQRGAEAWLVSHQRTAAELKALFPDDTGRMLFVEDQPIQQAMWRLGRFLPRKVAEISTGWISHICTQLAQRRILARLIAQEGINVIHEPIPVSPKTPSLTYDLGVPVVIGPLNGGMDYPPGFPEMQPAFERHCVGFGRLCSNFLNRMMPGKLHADAVLVANLRSRQALPHGCRGHIGLLIENGVDLALWNAPAAAQAERGAAVRFVFLGRLVDWKAVDILIEAFELVAAGTPAELHIVGDGAERGRLEALAVHHGLRERVKFHGFVPQTQCPAILARADAMVLPSLYECGGAVVLEAMAMGIPVIASDWGGPSDYLDDSCGILIKPINRQIFKDGLADAMLKLARNPALRRRLGQAGRAKVVREFDWDKKVDAMLGIYRRAVLAAARER